jgi:hypothetical protein
MKAKAMTQAETLFTGLTASAGFARGVVFCAAKAERGTYHRHKSTDAEYAHLVSAIEKATEATAEQMARAEGDAADILEFQVAMLGDDTFAESARALIEAGAAADTAWSEVLDREIESYAQSEEEYFRARTADLTDIRDRVLRALRGDAESQIPEGVIYLADDITPSTFLSHDWTGGGLALRQGSTTTMSPCWRASVAYRWWSASAAGMSKPANRRCSMPGPAISWSRLDRRRSKPGMPAEWSSRRMRKSPPASRRSPPLPPTARRSRSMSTSPTPQRRSISTSAMSTVSA